jgi:hypothetical protein
MKKDLFEQASEDPALLKQMADSTSSVLAKHGIALSDPKELVTAAKNDSTLKASLAASYSSLAEEHGLSFQDRSSASVEAAAATFSSIAKFKQDKDDPTHMSLDTPVVLMATAGALLFLPTLLSVSGK